MKRNIFLALIALLMLAACLTACDEAESLLPQQHVHTEVIDPEIPATGFATGLTEGKHCKSCQEILVAQEVIAIVPPVEIDFSDGYVTTEGTVIETDHLRLNLSANVYISDDLIAKLNLITSIMEEVSGMKFEGNAQYATDLMRVEVVKPEGTESELGPAFADVGGATISSGDLVGPNLGVVIHECSHVLKARQSPWAYCQWMEESISYSRIRIRP